LFSNIFYFTTSRINPRWSGTKLLGLFLLIRSFLKPPLSIDLRRLAAALDFPSKDIRAGSFDKSIELVFVAIGKDFPVLMESVNFAKKSIRDYQFGGVRVIVPDLEVKECSELFEENGIDRVSIIPESSLVTPESLVLLRKTFEGRANWVLQQILKVQAVLASQADASLIVDSDTLLLTKRPWFGSNGNQLLTPSYEYNPPYYHFLQRLGISDSNPKYTFISHHMLMQRKVLEETCQRINWIDIDKMVEYICRNANAELDSPICVEYELYAQSLFKYAPEKIHLGNWGNISIPRTYLDTILNSKFIMNVLARSFHSVSLHSWSAKAD